MGPLQVSQRLRELADEVGFDRVGLARVGLSAHGEAYLDWLERGEHGTMTYLAERAAERLDPSLWLPGVRSALCVASDYYRPTDARVDAGPPDAAAEPKEDHGSGDLWPGDLWPGVARYARGRDYHNLLGKRLRRLGRRLREEFPGCGTRCSVDTGPVLEREWAAAAGLGAVGKNTLLLHPEAGSWFFIGVLMTTLDVVPDPPIADLCGSCTACIDHCPTDALRPYTLDATRCISYWSIEHRGAVPETNREELGEWVYGCDICQEVCPVNTAPAGGGGDLDQYRVPDHRRTWSLRDLLLMTEETYPDAFRGSPMQRARLEGLKRNAAIAMGNRRDREDLPDLISALSDGSSVVRLHVAWALGQSLCEAALEPLRERLQNDPDASVRDAARTAVERISGSPISSSRGS